MRNFVRFAREMASIDAEEKRVAHQRLEDENGKVRDEGENFVPGNLPTNNPFQEVKPGCVVDDSKMTPTYEEVRERVFADPVTNRDWLREKVRDLFPNGHPDFIQRCIDEAELHNDKNHDYASGGRPLGNFERVAAILALYPGFPYDTPYGAAIVYAMKQLDAVLWGLAKNVEHKVEGFDPRCQDISVYFKLIPIMIKEHSEKS